MNSKYKYTKKIVKREWIKETSIQEFEYFLDQDDCADSFDVPYIRKGLQNVPDGGYFRNVEYDKDVPQYIIIKAKCTREIYMATLECGHKRNIKSSDPRKKMKCRECASNDLMIKIRKRYEDAPSGTEKT